MFLKLNYFLETNVGDWRRSKVLGDVGRRTTKAERAHGPSTRMCWPLFTLSDLRWKYDRMSWSLWTYWAVQTSVPCCPYTKNNKGLAMCLLLLFQASHWPGNYAELIIFSANLPCEHLGYHFSTGVQCIWRSLFIYFEILDNLCTGRKFKRQHSLPCR